MDACGWRVIHLTKRCHSPLGYRHLPKLRLAFGYAVGILLPWSFRRKPRDVEGCRWSAPPLLSCLPKRSQKCQHIAVGMECSRSPASHGFPPFCHITAFCRLHERHEETSYHRNSCGRVGSQWGCSQAAPWTNCSRVRQISLLTHKTSWAKDLVLSLGYKVSPSLLPLDFWHYTASQTHDQPWWMMPNSPAGSKSNSVFTWNQWLS